MPNIIYQITPQHHGSPYDLRDAGPVGKVRVFKMKPDGTKGRRLRTENPPDDKILKVISDEQGQSGRDSSKANREVHKVWQEWNV